jgi:hypothetical protein
MCSLSRRTLIAGWPSMSLGQRIRTIDKVLANMLVAKQTPVLEPS